VEDQDNHVFPEDSVLSGMLESYIAMESRYKTLEATLFGDGDNNGLFTVEASWLDHSGPHSTIILESASSTVDFIQKVPAS